MFELLTKSGRERWKERRARREAWREFQRDMEAKGLKPSSLIPSGQTGRPVPRTIDIRSVLDNRFKLSSWVYGCVRLRAQAVASVQWKVERNIGDEWVPAEEDHPLRLLLGQRANKHWTFHQLGERAQMTLDLEGESYIVKLRAMGVVRELWTFLPGQVSPVPSETEFIEEYEVNVGGRAVRVPARDVIVLMYPDPSNLYRGLSPLQAALRAVDADVDAVEWNRNLTQNRVSAETVFKFKHPLSDDQWDLAVERVREQYQGATNAGRPMVVDADMDVQSFGVSPKDMDWLEARRFNRQEIMSIYGCPPPMMQVYDDATLANIQTARRIFWQDTMMPVLGRYASSLTRGLASEFGEDLRVVPDLSAIEPLQEILRGNIDAAMKLWQMGVPLSEVNRVFRMGLDDLPGMDVPYVVATVNPADIGFVDPFVPANGIGAENDPSPEEDTAIEDVQEAIDDDEDEPPAKARRARRPADPDAWERPLLRLVS